MASPPVGTCPCCGLAWGFQIAKLIELTAEAIVKSPRTDLSHTKEKPVRDELVKPSRKKLGLGRNY